jgi:hypothetical protein
LHKGEQPTVISAPSAAIGEEKSVKPREKGNKKAKSKKGTGKAK